MSQNVNGVLKNKLDLEASVRALAAKGLSPHPVIWKCWDGVRMIDWIQREGTPSSRILDVGCIGCPMLHWLSALGYKHLYGCDLSPFWSWRNCIPLTLKLFLNPHIHFSRQNLEHTNYPSASFDFITSLSVIEHGISLPAYFQEMSRLLKPGGTLLTSTDYWPEVIDTRGLYPFGPAFGEMKIFDRAGILETIRLAGTFGLELIGAPELEAEEKLVSWMDRHYTFVLFALRKKATA